MKTHGVWMAATLLAACLASMLAMNQAAIAGSSANSSDGAPVFLDYRDTAFREAFPTYGRDVRDHVVPQFIGPDLHGPLIFGVPDLSSGTLQNFVAELSIRGDAEGAFLTQNRRQQVYLLAYGRPAAAGRPPERYTQVLLILEGGEMVDVIPLPVGANYQRLVGVADVTGDGRHELLLESAHFHMGQLVLVIDIVSLGENGGEIVSHLGPVYENSCGAPLVDQTVEAKVINIQPKSGGGSALGTQRWYAPCRGAYEPGWDAFIPLSEEEEK